MNDCQNYPPLPFDAAKNSRVGSVMIVLEIIRAAAHGGGDKNEIDRMLGNIHEYADKVHAQFTTP